MSSIDVSEIVAEATKTESCADHLKSVLQVLSEQSAVIKSLMNTVRVIIKDSDKTSKELEKLKNKKSRNKTERAANALPSGITKPVSISAELAKFLGVEPGTLVPRNEVTRGVSAFVKSNGLSNPENKQQFVLDDREPAKALRTLLGNPPENVTYFNLQRYLKHHYLPMPATEKVVVPKTPKASKSAKEPVVVAPVVVEPEAPAKKKIMVKKVKKTELTEEA
jgi:chromatin remodeling complex protein RSC6